ncbi:Peroxisome biogenesis factor 2 [Vanrija pseudolonga]|uniref:RING-type E3 ubiquitin transferase (cysteine targeting) n=1 Tax=Vanrija pseudolonga TaxID=143232 RepID=A0AAF0YFM6_9TREE|nr:Peroxisome biogenesis factor 2 [Vanrija pseudolonga]
MTVTIETIAVTPAPASQTRPYEPRAPLVNQVDAEGLDDGIASLLSDGVERAVSRFRPSLAPDFKPEIELVLKAAVFAAGVLSSSAASPGAALQNLRLASSRGSSGKPTRSILVLYILLNPSLLPSYLLSRARTTALSRQWPDLPAHDPRRKAWTLLVRIENLARAWELAGWGLFLYDREYPSLLMRILGLKLVPTSPHLARMVSYEFMNRQLVWGAMTEFLMFAIPRFPGLPRVLNPAVLAAPVKAFLSQPTMIDYEALSAAHTATNTAKKKGAPVPVAAHAGVVAGIPRHTCPVCYLRRTTTPVAISGTDISLPPLTADDAAANDEANDNEDRIFIPAQTDCWGGCKYCYYCIADELARWDKEQAEVAGGKVRKADKWTCLRCGGGVTRAWRAGAEPLSVETTSESEAAGTGSESEWEVVNGDAAVGSAPGSGPASPSP